MSLVDALSFLVPYSGAVVKALFSVWRNGREEERKRGRAPPLPLPPLPPLPPHSCLSSRPVRLGLT